MIYVNYYSATNALGSCIEEILKHLSEDHSPGLFESEQWLSDGQKAVFGNVLGALPQIPTSLKKHDSRNNRILLSVLQNCGDEFQKVLGQFSKDQVAVIMGTSTSGSDEADRYVSSRLTEPNSKKEFYGQKQELGDPSAFLSDFLGLQGPSYTISTACTSSARAIISGARLIKAGLVEAAIVGGADSLARLPIFGFSSLEVMSCQLCRPFSKLRQGITIGEGAGIIVLSKIPSKIFLAGFGESSDAHHISSPHPEGEGIFEAMKNALKMANLRPEEISYVNLHGTGTKLNDSSEGLACKNLFGQVRCSSTKNLTGHTLGAAGITEATLLCGLLDHQGSILPAQFKTAGEMDEAFEGLGLIEKPCSLRGDFMMTNNIAFGGNNTSLIFGRENAKQN